MFIGIVMHKAKIGFEGRLIKILNIIEKCSNKNFRGFTAL